MEGVTVSGLFKQAAENFPSRRAVSVSGKFDLTYSRLHELVERAAARLVASGIKAGDVVALIFPNTVEVCFFFNSFYFFFFQVYLVDLIRVKQDKYTCFFFFPTGL